MFNLRNRRPNIVARQLSSATKLIMQPRCGSKVGLGEEGGSAMNESFRKGLVCLAAEKHRQGVSIARGSPFKAVLAESTQPFGIATQGFLDPAW